MTNWVKLDKKNTVDMLDHLSDVADPSLFSPKTSEVLYLALSFYKDYMLYRITNYATMPSFSLDFLSDGETYFLLDGSATPINIVNARSSLHIHEYNVIDYVDFYLGNIHGGDGDVYLIKDPENLPFLDSLSLDQQFEIKGNHTAPRVMHDNSNNKFIVLADLYYTGRILKSALIIRPNGSIEIKPQDQVKIDIPTQEEAI